MIDRRACLGVVAGALAAAWTGVAAQPGSPYRLGLLHPGTKPAASDALLRDYYWAPLRELGYVEGKNLVVERRYAEGNFQRLPVMARELVLTQVDVILAVGTLATQAAKAATTTIPIVFLTNGDPVALGLVASLAKPGGNATGVLIAPEGSLAAKKLEPLREAVPGATRIAFLIPDDPGIGVERQITETREGAARLRVDVPVVRINGTDYATAFASVSATRADALFVGAHSFFVRDRSIVVALAAKHRLPAVYEWPAMVKAGGLMSYGASETETYRQVAVCIDSIFKGAHPRDVPVWQPSKLHLVINKTTARKLGLALPPSLLLRADEVIE